MIHLGMEHIRKIMEIMDDDEMFPTRNEWAYVKISNELKKLHFKIKRTLQGSPQLQSTLHAPPRIIRDAWRDLRTLRLRPRR